MIVPSILPLIFGADWVGSLVILVNQILTVLAIYIITSYGLVAISLWAIGRLLKTLGQTFQCVHP